MPAAGPVQGTDAPAGASLKPPHSKETEAQKRKREDKLLEEAARIKVFSSRQFLLVDALESLKH